MQEIKVQTKRGVLLDGVLFSATQADTVLIAITGIHGNFYSNPFYYNIGETLTLGELTHDIGINYNSEHFGFGIMMVNPFSPHGSRTVTKDLFSLAPTANTAVMQNYRQVLMLNFNFNLDFGSRASTRGYQRIYNEDTESGSMPPTRTASPCRRTSATALRLGESESPWRQTNQALSHSYLATE